MAFALQPGKPALEHGRRYQFAFLPVGFFSRLMARMLSIPSVNIVSISKFRLVISQQTKDGIIQEAFATYEEKASRLDFRVKIFEGVDHSHPLLANNLLLLILLDIVAALLKTFYHRQMGDQQVTQFVPCVHCLMTSPQTPENEVYYFPLDDCILSMKSGTHVMYCRQLALPSKCIRVLHLAPDIAMVGLTSIPANEISFGHTKSHSDSPHTESSPSISEHDNVGVGVSGSVRMGILNNIPVAVKEPHSYNSSSLGEFLYEAHIMTTIPPHPNIVRFFGVCSVPPCILLIMEFIFPATLSPSMWGHFDGNLKSSDLDHFLQAVWGSQKRNTDTDVVSLLLPCELRQRILYDVAAGMNHLHSLVPPLLHRDLHAGNIMICSLDWKAPSPVAKVTDFGLSERLFVAKTAGMQERLEVFPPELHAGKPYGLPADVWSFGTACFLLFSPPLATPYDFLLANPKFATIPRGTELASLKRSEVRQGLISGEVLPRPPEQCPNWASQLMSICWSHEPEQRPTFSWLTSNDSSPLLAGLKEACPFLGSTHNGPYFAEYSNSMPETIPSSPKPLYFVSGENNLNRASAYRCTQQANLRAVGGDSLVIVNCRKIISCASQWWCGCNNGNIVVLQPESLPEVASSSTADTEFRIIRRRWRAHIGQQSEVTALLYLPQSECVLSGSSGGEVKFWNSITFEHQGSILASHEQASILVLAIAPQTQQIWVGDSRGVASVWNLSETSLGMSMSMVWSTRISHNFHHHSSPLSPHSSSSITPASSSAVFSKTLPFHRSRYSPIVDISPLHDRVVIATAEVITVYTMDKFSPMAHLEGTDLAHQSLTCLTCVSSNGPAASQQSIWAGTSRGVIIAWDGNFNMKNSVQVHDRTVNGIITDPTFNLVWSCSFDGKAVAFDYTTFAPIHEVVVSKEEVHAIAVTQYCFPEQRISSKSWLATISHDDLVKFWQRTDNQSRFPSTPDKQLAASVFRRAVRSRVFQHNRRKFQADPNELLLLLRLQGNPLVYGQDFEFVGRIENTYDSPLFLASFTFPSDTNSPEERQVMFSIAVVPEDHLFSAHDLDVIEKKLFRVVERAKNENDVLHNIDRHPSIFPLFTSFFVKLPASIFHDSESLYRKQAAQGLHFHLCVYPSYDCTLATVISACTKTKAGLPFSSGCAVVPAVSVNLVNRIVSSLVSALNHMQTHFLVHADIQPSNVLLSENGTRVLLTGFGHSRFMRGNGTTVGPWCGSAFWCPQNSIIPPEVKEQLRTLTDPHRSLVNFSKADEFSVGVTVLHLMTAMVLPPQESEEVMQSATGSYNFDTIGNKLLPAQIFSRDLTEIVLLMASINPMERPHISSSLIDIVEGLT
ncbi:leucinerich repeat kinase [Pelomyxa schiedti]|nr:leucinerich repeat kinase [Pelomyxa schiedti]